jgi:hypothetical protein
MYEEARAEAQEVNCPPPCPDPNPSFLAAFGDRERALKVLEDLQFSKDNPELTYAALGEIDLAFHWLGKNIRSELEGGTFSYSRLNLKVDPVWDPLRDDPRFEEMIALMNFPE